jgi:hypothetical protein
MRMYNASTYMHFPLDLTVGHDGWNKLKDHWSIVVQFYTPFDSNMMKCNQFLRHIGSSTFVRVLALTRKD